MTIDSSWLHAFKEEAPHAFTPHRPIAHPRAIFVDGQIKLMQGAQREPITWDEFIHRHFARSLQRCYDTCDVVILAFDNYEHVPCAKCMTQAKRRKHVPPAVFTEHSELPCMVPDGERWIQCIANRTFKARVIDLVLLRLPLLLLNAGSPAARRLIVDYRDQPLQYRFDPHAQPGPRIVCEPLEADANMLPLGEADVKFTRYADRFRRLVVDSIDGDSIPIALMHFEKRLRVQSEPPQIAVYRMELHAAVASGTKRNETQREDRKRKSYEYVNIPALHHALMQVVAQCTGRMAFPSHRGHEMGMFVALIALTGTDFSRHLPQLSGKSVYGLLPSIWPALAMAYDPHHDALRVREATDLLIRHLYCIKFAKHVPHPPPGLAPTLAALLASKLSQRVKDTLPTVGRASCTVRNANWVLTYWGRGEDEGPTPHPIQRAYGYRALPNGATDYDDDHDDAADDTTP